MKHLMRFVLILTISVSCQKRNRDVAPSDRLYQKWQLTETKSGQEGWKPYAGSWVVEFRSDGTIHYLTSSPPCCSPVQFQRQAQELTYTAYYSGSGCEYVDCASASGARISRLTPDELILENQYGATNPASSYSLKYRSVH